jgi:hypothetical protein
MFMNIIIHINWDNKVLKPVAFRYTISQSFAFSWMDKDNDQINKLIYYANIMQIQMVMLNIVAIIKILNGYIN